MKSTENLHLSQTALCLEDLLDCVLLFPQQLLLISTLSPDLPVQSLSHLLILVQLSLYLLLQHTYPLR